MNPETWTLQRIHEIQRCWDMNPKTWILYRIHFGGRQDMNRRHGTCRGSWDIKILRHGSGDMDLAEDPEIHMDAENWIRRHGSCRGSWEKDAETWIRRHGSCRGSWDIRMLRHESGDMVLAEITWDTKMLRHESEDVGLVEDPEIQIWWDMNVEIWILQGIHIGGCDMIGHMEPETWILQRTLTYKDAEIGIRRHRSCRGSWDTKMLKHESEAVDLAGDSATWSRRNGSCKWSCDTKIWIRRHGSCRGSWEKDAETWIRRHGSCREPMSWDTKMLRHESGDMAEDPNWWMLRHESEDMDLVEDPEI